MGKKNIYPTQNVFDDKQILMPDGRPIETVPMQECMMHYDNRILSGLAIRVLVQAVQDWEKLNAKGRKTYAKADGGNVWRCEVARFFNSSFCSIILELMVPDLTHEEAVRNMNRLDFGRMLVVGCGNKTDYGYNRRKRA